MRKYFILSVMIMLFLGILGCASKSPAALEKQLAYRSLGLSQMSEGDYAEAAETFQLALDQSFAVIGGLELDICYYKALALVRSGNVTDAMRVYDALIDYDRRNAQAFYLRGSLYLQQQEMENALRDFQSALDVGGENLDLSIAVAENLHDAGLVINAQDVLRRTLNWRGDSPEHYRNLGYVHYLLGEYDIASYNLDKAAGQGDLTAVLYLAQVYETMGNTEQAQALYDTYLEQIGDPIALNRLGYRKMEEGDYALALACFQAGLATEDPVNEQALRRNEIAALEFLSEFQMARFTISAYVRDFPDDKEAIREYEFLKTRE